MFRTIQEEHKLDAFQRRWAYEAGCQKTPSNKSVQSFLYFIIGIIAPVGMMYRAFVNPEVIDSTAINVIFFASIIYLGTLFLHSFALGFTLLLYGAFALKFNEAKRIDGLGSYRLLKSMVAPYTSIFRIIESRFKQLLSLVFVLGCVMVGGWWTLAAVLAFIMAGWIHFCKRSCRNYIVDSLGLLTPEAAEDFESGHDKPTNTLFIDGIVVESKVSDDTRTEKTYLYEAMDLDGLEIKDQISASSESEALQKVKEKGLYVTRISLKDNK